MPAADSQARARVCVCGGGGARLAGIDLVHVNASFAIGSEARGYLLQEHLPRGRQMVQRGGRAQRALLNRWDVESVDKAADTPKFAKQTHRKGTKKCQRAAHLAPRKQRLGLGDKRAPAQIVEDYPECYVVADVSAAVEQCACHS
ncbi:hypothetical protein T492DRAFT_389980 [Pavlovales sp. CCMP2436]|nr:hypothetical protein T492DRAFT_389980 [Pavlovales sp. CCMP2436]